MEEKKEAKTRDKEDEELGRPPTQEEYVKTYLEICEEEIHEKHVNPEDVSSFGGCM